MTSAPTTVEMSQEIDELMRMIGVAPRDFAAARINYEKLSSDEVHRRLNKFRHSRERLKAKVAEANANEALVHERELHPRIPPSQTKFTTTNTLEALARLENVIDHLQPDILVGVNAEGMTVGNFVRQHMNLSAPIVEASGTAAHGVIIEEFSPVKKASVVAVIGHAAKSGDTLIEAMRQAMNMFDTEFVFGGILLASAGAAGILNKRPIYYHQIADYFQDSYGSNAVDCLSVGQSRSDPSISPVENATLDIVRREIAEMCQPAEWTRLLHLRQRPHYKPSHGGTS